MKSIFIFIISIFSLNYANASCSEREYLLRAEVCECSNRVLIKCHSDACQKQNIELTCQGQKLSSQDGGALKMDGVVMLYDRTPLSTMQRKIEAKDKADYLNQYQSYN